MLNLKIPSSTWVPAGELRDVVICFFKRTRTLPLRCCFLLVSLFCHATGMQDLNSLSRDGTVLPAAEAGRPNHWASREVPAFLFLDCSCPVSLFPLLPD